MAETDITPILDVTSLAVRYCTTPHQIRKINSENPSQLPPRFPFGRRLLWRLADVEPWEAARVAAAAAQPTAQAQPSEKGRRGPKSVAAKARQAAAAAIRPAGVL